MLFSINSLVSSFASLAAFSLDSLELLTSLDILEELELECLEVSSVARKTLLMSRLDLAWGALCFKWGKLFSTGRSSIALSIRGIVLCLKNKKQEI